MKDKESNELEFNRKNREDFEQLMEETAPDRSNYWDRSNPFVRLLLLILGVIIIGGVVYYVLMYLNH